MNPKRTPFFLILVSIFLASAALLALYFLAGTDTVRMVVILLLAAGAVFVAYWLIASRRRIDAQQPPREPTAEPGDAHDPRPADRPTSGDRTVSAQTIDGPVATGDNARQINTHIYNENPPPPDPPDPADAAELRYLQTLAQRCNVLPLGAMGGMESGADDITLEQVYIDLDTQTRIPVSADEQGDEQGDERGEWERQGRSGADEEPLSALEAARQHPKLVLLGDPGSGKSTFVRYLVGWLALARLGKRDPVPGWARTPLPLLLTLRDIAPALGALDWDGLSDEAVRRALVETVHGGWRAQLAACDATACAARLTDELRGGNVVLCFDGLDEVPPRLRVRVRQAIHALHAEYGRVRQTLVTCRVRSYVDDAVLPTFREHRLAAFDEKKIERFIAGWYGAAAQQKRLSPNEARTRATDLQRAVGDPGLRDLAPNPMLLTTMAIIHQRDVGLPRERVRLYDEAVHVLLYRWQRSKGETGSAALRALLTDDGRLRTILQALAHRVHARQAAGEGDDTLTRGELLTLLEQPAYVGDLALVQEFLDYIDQRAGLLVGHGGTAGEQPHARGGRPHTYSFPHRTFQEYLAGCQMVQGRGRLREFKTRAGEGDFWYLAAQLGAEELYHNRGRDAQELLDLAYHLRPDDPQHAGEWRALLWSGHMADVLGKATIVADGAQPGGDPDYLERIRAGLLALMRRSPLTAVERADAGRMLARLGDPRIEVLDPLRMAWCEVPAGPFRMGSTEELAAYDDEEPQHEFTIPYAYRISRYPITNAQFGVFVEAGGYAEASYWTEAAAAGFWQAGGFKGQFDNDFRQRPQAHGEPHNLPNHPVVGVSWYEALAFARWLTHALHASGDLPPDWRVGLPSEPEWEKAARGGDGRIYPWGREPDPDRANYADTGIGTPSAVGCFPGGASPYEVEELSGNVWEWTRSLDYDEYGYPYDAHDGREALGASLEMRRVLRGGSFGLFDVGARAAYRALLNPYFANTDLSFRVVASPLL